MVASDRNTPKNYVDFAAQILVKQTQFHYSLKTFDKHFFNHI